jgi:hypothetical protein
MINKVRSQFTGAIAIALALGVFAPMTVLADENDPPSRAGRLAYAQGSVSFEPAGTEDWVSAVVNRPLTTGDRVWSDVDGRAEVQLDGSLLRLSSNTAMSFLNLSDNVTQVQLSAGTLVVRVRRLDDNEAYEIDTPNLAFTIARPGLYRLTIDPTGTSTAIRVRRGAGAVTGGGTSYTVQDNEDDVFTGTDQLVENGQQYDSSEDQFDAWSSGRDDRWQNSASARYVSADVVGYEDLDEHGAWRPAPGYGNVWFPRSAGADWAPYHNGHWAYIEPWGYSWVDDQPWGFAPFHYGRWVSVDGAWGWVPSPPRVEGVVYVRPVYAPALVAWVGTGAAVAWFALGPREVYVPSYPVSRNYVNNVNVSNTTVNTTVVNNVYNTTVINNTTNVTNTKNVTNVTNIKYVNQRVPGAITATTHEAFASAQPVARNTVKVDVRAIASAPVRALAPPITPAKQAVLGTGRAAARKPPAAVQTRVVVAKVAPPPPPPPFEKRQEAIKNNGGKPLSTAQVRQIQPAAQQHAAVVKVAPPAKPGTPQSAKGPTAVKAAPGASAPKAPAAEAGKAAAGKPAEAQAKVPAPPADKKPADRKEDRPANGSAARSAEPGKAAEAQAKAPATPGEKKPADRPVASGNAARPAEPGKPPATQAKTPETSADKKPAAAANSAAKTAPAPAHPKETATAASSAAANAQLEAKHQQEQAQLRAKQEQERQKAQQQQDLQRKQLEQQKSDQAKKQQLAQQQQEQAKQLQQKHAQEQQALQQKQQQEKQQAAKAPAKDTKDTKDDHPTK